MRKYMPSENYEKHRTIRIITIAVLIVFIVAIKVGVPMQFFFAAKSGTMQIQTGGQ